MKRARFEILEDDGTFCGEIPGFRGVLANARTLKECRAQLEEVLDEWLLLRVVGVTPAQVLLAVKKMGVAERRAFIEDLLAATSPKYLAGIREARGDRRAGRVKSLPEVFRT
jgi:hypothetical protein